jgi:hypothetical protein
MSLNHRKVITGGLLAGIIIIIINILGQFVLIDRIQQEMNTWMQGSADRIIMGAGAIAAGIIMKLLIGIILIWFYAAIRPRFGPGPRTASYVAITVWILGAIYFSDFPLMGMMSVSSYALLEIMQFITFLIATLVGARIYSDQGVPNTTETST